MSLYQFDINPIKVEQHSAFESPCILSDATFRQYYDRRSWLRKKIDTLKSLIYESFSSLSFFIDYSFKSRFSLYKTYDTPTVWKTHSQGLYVLIHGLNGHPGNWNTHLQCLKNQNSSSHFDYLAPLVPFQGNCSLEEAGDPILDKILTYTQQHPQRPICLISYSNGARIATWLDLQLRSKAPQTPVKISSIAGVHFGSPLINKLNRYGISKYFLHQAIREELAYGSLKAQSLLKNFLEPLPHTIQRDYEFYAGTGDAISLLGSALPILNKGEKHYLVHGCGHLNMIKAVRKKQLASCISWMHSHTYTPSS